MRGMTTAPVTVQTAGVTDAKPTDTPELAVAAIVNGGVPKAAPAMRLKLIFCGVWPVWEPRRTVTVPLVL